MPTWLTPILVAVMSLVGVWLGSWMTQRGAERAANQTLEGQRIVADAAARREWRRQQVAPYLEATTQRFRLWLELNDAMTDKDDQKIRSLTEQLADREWFAVTVTYLALPDEAFKRALERFFDAEGAAPVSARTEREVADITAKTGMALVQINRAAERYIFSVPQLSVMERFQGEPL